MRLTKDISKKQNYCEFELKKCKYQDIYDFKKYSELEDYANCDLTLAIDKLGQVEDIEEKHNVSSLDDLDNRLTALKIIKEKSVSVGILQMCPNLDAYNNRIIEHPNVVQTKKLTQEEYDLLKEVLK